VDTRSEAPDGGPESAPDEALLARVVAGDAVAMTLVLTRDYSRLHAHLSRRIPASLRSQLDPDDIIQETHIAVFRNAARFEPRGADAWYRWVATIAIRKLRNAIQASATLKRGAGRGHAMGNGRSAGDSVAALMDLLAGPETTPSRHAASKEAQRALEEAVAQLPGPFREAVRLVYLEGLSPGDAAVRMHRSVRAVHNLCHKAKRKLSELLGSESRFFSRPG